jgi:F0F1-type ATP synthase membrane subunit b/b'
LALRQSIRKSVTSESKLLDSIGTAQLEREMQRRVLAIAKKASDDMAEKTSVEASMTEDEIKDYIERVMKELESKR